MGSGSSKAKDKPTSATKTSKEDKITTETKEKQEKNNQTNTLTETTTKNDTIKAAAPAGTSINKANEKQTKGTLKTNNANEVKNENTNSNVEKSKENQSSSTNVDKKDTKSNKITDKSNSEDNANVTVKAEYKNHDGKEGENKNSDGKTEENKNSDGKIDENKNPDGKMEENKNTDGKMKENKNTGRKMEENKNLDGQMEGNKKSDGEKVGMVLEEEEFTPLESEDQRKFDDAVNSTCLLVKPDSIIKKVTKNITKLQLPRALPYTFSLYNLLTKMSNLQELDLSNNNIGPQGFRSICLAMCSNSSILSLNLAGNMTDTDSAECLGKMVLSNKTLEYLDVSSNYFGKDYFSRCVGPALKTNTSLRTLRAESIGSTDVRLLMEGLQDNTSLIEIDLSRNSVSDISILGTGFADCLKKDTCSLVTLNLCNCEIGSNGIVAFTEGLQLNTTLQELNLGGNEFGSLENLLKFVVVAASHPKLRTVNLDEVKIKDKSIKSKDISVKESDFCSSLHCLSLTNSHLTDEFWEVLMAIFKGRQLPLTDINLNNNGDLTPNCIDSIASLTSGPDNPSTVRKISYSLNKADGLPEKLLSLELPFLTYLNIRKSSCKMSEVIKLSQLYTLEGHKLSTLILDGLKLSSTNTLEKLMENATKGTLTTLSLGGCSLVDEDLKPLCTAIKNGLSLHMLKLSANRITDEGMFDLVEALLTHKTHPLAVLDISTNTIQDEGAKRLSTLFTTKKHTSKLHSLNISSNSIGKEGLLSLVTVIGGKYPLRTLYLSDQSKSQDENDMVQIFERLATSLGFSVKKQGESLQPGCSDIPVIPEGLVINLKGLGGNTGEIGKMLDSPRIRTDYTHDQLPTLSFEHCQEIAAYLKGTGSNICIWSSEEWKKIIGADRPTTDTPSWLQVAASRDVAVYLSNLPGNATIQKIEALLEMEADCNLDEICLMKDPVTRKINGVGWGLLMDQESVQKAVEFFRSGEAKVFGQAFMVSRIKVKVDDEANTQSEENARQELEDRLARMKKEEKAHRLLIQRRAEEQWKRHAYRLAHPAYADGRIW